MEEDVNDLMHEFQKIKERMIIYNSHKKIY